tara:strand:- start:195 stop:575 length:381 start_codon:yes stop_codon:yes gene_type:complete
VLVVNTIKDVMVKESLEQICTNTKQIRKMADNKLKMTDEDLAKLAMMIVTRMNRLKTLEDWYKHIASTSMSWAQSYNDLELTEEENALGEAAKLMTLMNMFKEDEEYEKCAIIRNRMNEVNKILKK